MSYSVWIKVENNEREDEYAWWYVADDFVSKDSAIEFVEKEIGPRLADHELIGDLNRMDD